MRHWRGHRLVAGGRHRAEAARRAGRRPDARQRRERDSRGAALRRGCVLGRRVGAWSEGFRQGGAVHCQRPRGIRGIAVTQATRTAPVDRPVFGRRDPDARGYYGAYGGRFVPETLVAPVAELEAAYFAARIDPAFVGRLRALLRAY